ncbi:hypothetical protein HCB26_00605 [Listeria booriae]|uniref:Uncharacterized protein n=1 Tax=Listeria booriae TaxID=1552123 RepID=A0A7X1D467_9LIST|nr:hypothetical protein [Listeria booriae]MBC2165069.1 hypothetical protein [Listeria booriae]
MSPKYDHELQNIQDEIHLIPDSDPYKRFLKLGLNQIKLFEDNKKNNSTVSIRIHSELASGTIDLLSLNTITSGLQKVFSSAINNIKGNANDFGLIPADIANESKLILTNIAPGSFIVMLRDNEPVFSQESIFTEEKSIRNIAVLDDLFKMISTIHTEDEAEKIVENYGVRTLNITKSWFKNMSILDANFEYENLNSEVKYKLDSELIINAEKKLSALKVKKREEPKDITGVLIGVIPTTKQIELRLGKSKKIRVKILDRSLADVNLVTNSTYELPVIRTKIINSAGKEKTIYQANSAYDLELVETDTNNAIRQEH